MIDPSSQTPIIERLGEFEQVTVRGKRIIRVIWDLPCSVCGARFRMSLHEAVPPHATKSQWLCFEHRAGDWAAKRARRESFLRWKRGLRAPGGDDLS